MHVGFIYTLKKTFVNACPAYFGDCLRGSSQYTQNMNNYIYKKTTKQKQQIASLQVQQVVNSIRPPAGARGDNWGTSPTRGKPQRDGVLIQTLAKVNW